MRALLLGVALLLAVSPQGWAGDFREPTLQEPRILRLPAEQPASNHRDRSAEVPANLKPFEQPAPPPNIMHFGPIETEIRNGHVTTYLEGAHVLGGNVSGSVDGRGASIMLHWPNN